MTMAENLILNEAAKKDFSRLLEFMKLVDRDFVPPLSERGSIEDEVRNALASEDEHYLIAEKKGGITAVAKYIENYSGKKDSAYIKYLAVHPARRGRGIGISVRKKVLELLKKKGVREVHSRTWSANKAMLGINKKMGFEIEKVVKNERAPGIDGIYFRKKL